MLESGKDHSQPLETLAMRSPFPGMDPYLEQFWGDVHHRLITYASETALRNLRLFIGLWRIPIAGILITT